MNTNTTGYGIEIDDGCTRLEIGHPLIGHYDDRDSRKIEIGAYDPDGGVSLIIGIDEVKSIMDFLACYVSAMEGNQ